MSIPFLLEIGTEEIPDWMIAAALNHLQDSFQKLIDQNSLGGMVARTDATPRRLALFVKKLIAEQPDTEELLLGPPKSAGAGAANGFARKMGTTPDQLGTETTPKGEYFSFRKKVKGRQSKEILAEALPGLILGTPWPKTMYWNGKGTSRFIRPIRWLVALLGNEVVPFTIEGVQSGNSTQGHRILGQKNIAVTIDTYEQQLRDNFAELSTDARYDRIAAFVQASGAKLDIELARTLSYMTEWPTPIVGSFDAEFLELPREILVTVMRHHQRYFAFETESGELAPQFVAVMNTDADPEGLVQRGNERVLRARFNDGRFFWQTDLKRKLEDRVADLAHVTFQAKLGSYLDKTHRVVELTKQLGGDEHAQRAALLAKTDLTADMVKEFTELQGVVGGLYARHQGEPAQVWRAIYDHYKPLSMDDSIPATHSGKIVALADKLDTLRECFRIGLIPSGSKDPFALRRAAQGVVKILVEGKLDLKLDLSPELREFLRDRIEHYFREVRAFEYDEVRAVLSAGFDNLPDVEQRLEALREVRPTEDFEPLAASFKRIQNILKQAHETKVGQAVSPARLEPGPETDLYEAMTATRAAIQGAPYAEALKQIAALRPKVDLFFDKVLVNAKDEAVRHNRLALLKNLLTEFSTIADFSEIVTTNLTSDAHK
ncbi:MAG TPA: glycine--tRNA ligase subunit beta [Bryobacteraceae bacterium]|nr:glycine--tRNA ligase subunit beta [Bryobacteraceae bacterium]